jgi:hypothetical protein
MKLITLILALFVSINLIAQQEDTPQIKMIMSEEQRPLGEWYVISGERYDDTWYIDYENYFDAEVTLRILIDNYGYQFEKGIKKDKFASVVETIWEFEYIDESTSGTMLITLKDIGDAKLYRISMKWTEN